MPVSARCRAGPPLVLTRDRYRRQQAVRSCPYHALRWCPLPLAWRGERSPSRVGIARPGGQVRRTFCSGRCRIARTPTFPNLNPSNGDPSWPTPPRSQLASRRSATCPRACAACTRPFSDGDGNYKLSSAGNQLQAYRKAVAENHGLEPPPPRSLVKIARKDWPVLLGAMESDERPWFIRAAATRAIRIEG
jgi:hypothetical protein